MFNHFNRFGLITAWGTWDPIVYATILCFSVVLLCIAMWYDVSCREIPNGVSYGFVGLWGCLALGYSVQSFWQNLQFIFLSLGGQNGSYQGVQAFIPFGSVMGHLWESVMGAIIIFGVFFFLWLIGGFGGGDGKLIASSALLFTPISQIQYVFNMALMGGILVFVYYGLSYIGKRYKTCKSFVNSGLESQSLGSDKNMRKLSSLMSVLNRVWCVERWRVQNKAPLPYGVAIAAGFLVTFLYYR